MGLPDPLDFTGVLFSKPGQTFALMKALFEVLKDHSKLVSSDSLCIINTCVLVFILKDTQKANFAYVFLGDSYT